MSRPRVYVETTIPSFYHSLRTGPATLARQEWTRRWWDMAQDQYALVTSHAVLMELKAGTHPITAERLGLLAELPKLATDPPIPEIVDAYFRHRLMPRNPSADAFHLALASYHKCEFLVTWNCQHLANANKFGHIRRVNTLLGLYVPTLVTPLELLGEDENDEPDL